MSKAVKRFKYPRTPHVPWSPGVTSDDKRLSRGEFEAHFRGKYVIVTEKLDGENTTIYSDGYVHARSIDSKAHPSRDWLKGLAPAIAQCLVNGERLFVENLFATHSIHYDNLPSFISLLGVADDQVMYSWNALGGVENDIRSTLNTTATRPPVLWEGRFDIDYLLAKFARAPEKSAYGNAPCEGFVIRTANQFRMEDFDKNVAKWVRANHVQTDEHWMNKPVERNGLAPR